MIGWLVALSGFCIPFVLYTYNSDGMCLFVLTHPIAVFILYFVAAPFGAENINI